MAYEIDYNDKRFTEVENAKQAALSENETMYQGMIDKTDGFYQAQIDASKEYADKQTQLQQEQTDFAIEQIEQQKAQAHKNYLKEQSGAYVDYQRQSNDYSVGAEQRAASGLSNTGYSESSRVAMYNTYQNRVATARESYNQAVLSYDNAIKDARLQNNSKLAELTYNTLQAQLEFALQGFQYKNQLLLDKANTKLELENMYYGRFRDVLSQLNEENVLAEEIRQFNEKMAEEKRQANANYALSKAQLEEEKRQFNAQLELQKKNNNVSNSRGSNYSNTGNTVVSTKGDNKSSNSGENPLNKLVGYGTTSNATASGLPKAQAALQKQTTPKKSGYSLVKDILGKGML